MKRILNRSLLVFFVALLVLVGMGYFIVEYCINSKTWVQQPYNDHIAGSNGLSKAGTIYDRNDVALAWSENGKREYHPDYQTRCSLLHVVGDDSFNISTSIQSSRFSELTGYNFIWGAGLPQSLKQNSTDMKLTVDAETCRTALEALGDHDGACVVYNYKTGEIICEVSTKTYDPANRPSSEEIEKNYDGVYLDKVLSSTFTPGSTFKVVTSAAAIENIPDIYDRTFHCDGEVEIDGSKITCEGVHGDISFKDALAQSCNVVFAEIAVEVGSDSMNKAAEEMGVTKSFSVDDNPTVQGHFNVSDANKNQLGWSGIGQYTDLVNPMQMAIMCGSIANGGETAQPYIIKESSSVLKNIGKTVTNKKIRLMDGELSSQLNDLMRYTVESNYGDSMFNGLTVCAKTGTAEVGKDKEPNAWMIGYSQDESCPLAFAVVVENAGYGYYVAGPVAVAAMTQAAIAIG